MTNWDEVLLPYSQAVDELMVKFNGISDGYNMLDIASPIESVEGRVKRISSIVDKSRRKNIPTDEITSKIEDIAGIRIICRFIGDIEKVLSLIQGRNGIDLEILKERDYINTMKASGYRSYHLIIKYPVITVFGYTNVLCEIQIRTLAMNFWATIEHSLRYKYKGQIPEHLQVRLIVSSEAAARLDNELNEIRLEIVDAQIAVRKKTDLIDDILTSMQMLNYKMKIEHAAELNEQFFSLHEADDFDGLVEFNRKLKIMKELNKK